MAATLISSVSLTSTDSNGFTTGSINTTGATLLVAVQACVSSVAYGTITDSKSNSWTNKTPQGSILGSRISFSVPSSVGSGHTFSVSGSGNSPGLWVGAFGNGPAGSSSFDQENGAESTLSVIQPGSITPGSDGQVLVVGACFNTAGTNGTIDLSFIEDADITPGSGHVGIYAAYLIQSTAAARNPTITWSPTESLSSAVIASFNVTGGSSSGIIKTIDNLAFASIKTVQGLVIASVKTIDGLAAQ